MANVYHDKKPAVTCTNCGNSSEVYCITREPANTAAQSWMSLGGVRIDLPAYPADVRQASLRAIDDMRRYLDVMEAALRVFEVAPEHQEDPR